MNAVMKRRAKSYSAHANFIPFRRFAHAYGARAHHKKAAAVMAQNVLAPPFLLRYALRMSNVARCRSRELWCGCGVRCMRGSVHAGQFYLVSVP